MSSEVVVLGGGVGGTLTANLVAKRVGHEANVTLIDSTGQHVYQPGFLYVALGLERPEHLRRDESRLLRDEIKLVREAAVLIDPESRKVKLASGQEIPYDFLVLATGSRTVMREVPGADDVHTFYTMEGAIRLHQALEQFRAGTVLVGVAGIPYKCPPAPVEFVFMLDDYLRGKGVREQCQIKLLSPLNRAFTIETTSKLVQPILAERGIELCSFFNVESVDAATRTVSSLEGESLQYDLLVLVPPHRGQQVIEDSGLGDERGWVPVDKQTLRHEKFERIWALGDATNIPISKSGSVAHYESPIVADEVAAAVRGEPAPPRTYEGKVMCFLETGRGQATTIQFDYEHPAKSPHPSRIWHWGKALFNRTYWHTVPQGRLPD